MPSASERTAVSAKPGRRRNSRAANRRSARTELMSLAWTGIMPKGLAFGSLRQNVDVVLEEIVGAGDDAWALVDESVVHFADIVVLVVGRPQQSARERWSGKRN